MSQRIQIATVQGDAIKAMMGLEKYLASTELDTVTRGLIKLRASMLNQCAYCIQMHTQELLQQGETPQKLFALAAWQESPLFTPAQRAVLALTDEVTQIAAAGVSDSVYQAAIQHLGESCVAEALMQIVTINAWNRIALTTKMVHRLEEN